MKECILDVLCRSAFKYLSVWNARCEMSMANTSKDLPVINAHDDVLQHQHLTMCLYQMLTRLLSLYEMHENMCATTATMALSKCNTFKDLFVKKICKKVFNVIMLL